MTWRQLSQLLAFVSKFPTLLYYKMMGITPLVFSTLKWRNSNPLQNYGLFLELTKFFRYVFCINFRRSSWRLSCRYGIWAEQTVFTLTPTVTSSIITCPVYAGNGNTCFQKDSHTTVLSK